MLIILFITAIYKDMKEINKLQQDGILHKEERVSETKSLAKESFLGLTRGAITGLLLGDPISACANALTFAVATPTVNKTIEHIFDTKI